MVVVVVVVGGGGACIFPDAQPFSNWKYCQDSECICPYMVYIILILPFVPLFLLDNFKFI